jgi:penicillin-binding protein 1A
MVRVDAKTGKLATPSSSEEYFLPFKVGSEPTETAPSSGANGEGPASDDDLFKQTF